MADISQSNWSETDASNNAASPNGWTSSTMLPSQVEPTARGMMGAIKRWWDRINGTLTSGGTNTITLSYAVAPPAYVTGEVYRFIAGGTNTGVTTLNVNILGAKAVQWHGAALVGGEIVIGRIVECVYDGTQFQLAHSQLVVSSTALATVATSGSASDLSAGTLAIARGGTNAATAAAAFANIAVAASSITSNGNIKFQNGLVIEWGNASYVSVSSLAVTFSLAFPSGAFALSALTDDTGTKPAIVLSALSASGATFSFNGTSTGTLRWIAVGN